MNTNSALGWLLFVPGVVLILIGAVWGHAGYYASDAVYLLLLVGAGLVLAVLGGRMLRKPKQDATPVQWRSPDRTDGE